MDIKELIIEKLKYTELAYGRINKKLKINLKKSEIEELIIKIILSTKDKNIYKVGKNFYLINEESKIKLTINSNTFTFITANKIKNES